MSHEHGAQNAHPHEDDTAAQNKHDEQHLDLPGVSADAYQDTYGATSMVTAGAAPEDHMPRSHSAEAGQPVQGFSRTRRAIAALAVPAAVAAIGWGIIKGNTHDSPESHPSPRDQVAATAQHIADRSLQQLHDSKRAYINQPGKSVSGGSNINNFSNAPLRGAAPNSGANIQVSVNAQNHTMSFMINRLVDGQQRNVEVVYSLDQGNVANSLGRRQQMTAQQFDAALQGPKHVTSMSLTGSGEQPSYLGITMAQGAQGESEPAVIGEGQAGVQHDPQRIAEALQTTEQAADQILA